MSKDKEEDSKDIIFRILQEHEKRLDKIEDKLENIRKIVTYYTPKIKKLESEIKLTPSQSVIPQNILVVDDDRNIVNTFKMILEGKGYIVDTAYNALDAMRKANKLHYDLAIVDMALPDTLGDVLVEELMSIHDNLSIIMVTGYSNYKDQIQQNPDSGELLMKPVDPEKLIAATQRALKKKEKPQMTSSAK